MAATESDAKAFGQCRCCLKNGYHKYVTEPYYRDGIKKIYSELFLECFNLFMSTNTELTNLICTSCICRLNDALEFKIMVAESEQQLLSQISSNKTFTDAGVNLGLHSEVDIKIEPEEVLKEEPQDLQIEHKVAVKRESQDCIMHNDDAVNDNGTRALQKSAIEGTDYRIEGGSYICSHCEKACRCKKSLWRHIKQKHLKIPVFRCPHCKLAFQNEVPLTIHKLQEHNIDDRSKCKECDTIFNTKKALLRHTQSFHMSGRKLKCDFCEYETFVSFNMYRHKITHKTEKDFQCRHCRKSFKRKSTLLLHEKIHTGDKRKVCKECGKAFVQKASLKYHMTKYHPEVNF